MKPVNPIKNQYRGINAHLHSFWQGVGGWDEFHANHIANLTAALKSKLLPMGYTASNQPSLQIRIANEPVARPRSDVTIYDKDYSRAYSSPSGSAISGVKIPDLLVIEEEFDEYRAIGVYEFVLGQEVLGEPVAWLELLSPSNKPGGPDARNYRLKRQHLLKSGVVFVELDYLHETPPTLDGSYFHGASLIAHPYRIVVIDPRPEFYEGRGYPNEFDVEQPIPTVTIPLNASDVLMFNFDSVYQTTFEAFFYGEERVDYTRLPLNFDRYSRDDQARILNRMIAVLEAAQQGIDLDKLAEPLPVSELPLDEALGRVQQLMALE